MDFLTSEVTIVEAPQRQKTGSLQKTGSSNKGKKDDDKGYHSEYMIEPNYFVYLVDWS